MAAQKKKKTTIWRFLVILLATTAISGQTWLSIAYDKMDFLYRWHCLDNPFFSSYLLKLNCSFPVRLKIFFFFFFFFISGWELNAVSKEDDSCLFSLLAFVGLRRSTASNLKQRQRQNHKKTKFNKQKQSLCTCVLNFGAFLCRPLQNNNVKLPKFSHFVENANIRRWIFHSLS